MTANKHQEQSKHLSACNKRASPKHMILPPDEFEVFAFEFIDL